ncbi:F-box/WD repeat-containing protein 9 isoform X1 [Scleropages formosus]|uniref:F-box/WD repeat-containing protein 9 isoform X1 n=1 Tax=Scleropages formosus TaxID=113540 RepID=UPI0008784C5E|nr:F-box/WD repeat-containing protein 9 isoform X1 [Scleropages formosus]
MSRDTERRGSQGRSMLPVSPSLTSPGSSPSACNEGAALLFLPWEILARIVSHLPAQCVIQVLPKVCRLFQSLSEDSTAWQIRARRLIGPNRSFPLGPSEGFDWPTACLEMEQLTRSWTKSEEGIQGAEGERDAQEEDRDGARAEERKEREEGPGIEDGVEDAEARLDDEDERIERFLEELDSDRNPSHSLSCPSGLEYFSLPSGHIAQVNCVMLVGGEGAVCASGSRDRNVNLWDVRKRVLLRTLGDPGLFSTHRGWVWCLAAHGPLLCSGSFDSTVRLWDLAAGGAERGLIQGRAAVLCLSCQDHVLLAGSYDKNVSIYDTRASDPLVKSLRLHGNAVLCLSADEKYILSGSKDNTLAVFDRRAGKLLQKLRMNSYLMSVTYSGGEVWAGDNHGRLHTFSLQDGFFRHVSRFDEVHCALVTGIHRSLGTLYTCSSDRTIKVHLPCAPPKTLFTLHHQSGINGLSVDAGVMAVASGNICVDVWRERK